MRGDVGGADGGGAASRWDGRAEDGLSLWIWLGSAFLLKHAGGEEQAGDLMTVPSDQHLASGQKAAVSPWKNIEIRGKRNQQPQILPEHCSIHLFASKEAGESPQPADRASLAWQET